MEDKILEAKEWLKHHLHSSQIDVVEDCMIKFAKLHVQLALKKAYKNVKHVSGTNNISKLSIISAYSLTNIK